MPIGRLMRQTSAGILAGISAVIFALSFGAILFPGVLAQHIGFSIGLTLVTAIAGALLGVLSQEHSFIGGPDSKIIAVLASICAALGAQGLDPALALKLALLSIFLVSLLSTLLFLLLAKFKMADLVRYTPFPVLAGFLAATGWLLVSAALTIAGGVPLTLGGMQSLTTQPHKSQLVVALCVAAALFAFKKRISQAILMPTVLSLTSALVFLIVSKGWCDSGVCRAEDWYFAELHDIRWTPPWKIGLEIADATPLIAQFPAMLVASFVGLMSVLLSLASLELSYEKEFDLNHALKAHAATTGIAALLGGFVGVVSISRTNLNRDAGGTAWSGVVAATVCLAVLLGTEDLLSSIPRPAIAGLILFLGASLLKQWLWDQRKTTPRFELAEVLLILVLIVSQGYLFGFLAGLVISCLVFVVTYSQLPLAGLATNLSLFSSSVIRSSRQTASLKQCGSRIMLFRLRGYVFFGSANKIEKLFFSIDSDDTDGVVIDLSGVSGIDRSAIGVFQRVLRRFHDRPMAFYFVAANSGSEDLRAFSVEVTANRNIRFFASLDSALEFAEDQALSLHGQSDEHDEWMGFLENEGDRKIFLGYCRLQRVAKGEAICRQGEFSNEIYFVGSGAFDVVEASTTAAGLRLAKLGRGAMTGEMAFYSGEARTASIVALADSDVYVLHRDSLMQMRVQHGDLATRFDQVVICRIAESLRRTNRLLATLI